MNKEHLRLLKQEDLVVGMEVSQLGEVTISKDEKRLVLRKYIISDQDIINPSGIFYYDSRRKKEVSKNYYDTEIKAKLPDGSLYLKMGVKKTRNEDDLNYDEPKQFLEYEGTELYTLGDSFRKLRVQY